MRHRSLAIMLVAIPAALVACGGGNSGGTGTSSGTPVACPAGSGSSGNGAHVKIGSKAFAEEQLLATMTQLVLQAHGFTVDYSFMAKDKAIGQALQNGTIDMYWQYTGTELTDYLGLATGSFPTDLTQAFAFVQQKDLANQLCWTSPGQFDDTNGIAIKASDAGTYGTTLTQFGQYLQAHPGVKVCILSEFRTRSDGLPGLESKYTQAYSTAAYIDIQSTAEKAIASGQCAAGEVFTTDSGIQANSLMVLQDDKKLFPPDNVGLVVRQGVLQRSPAIAALMAPVAQKLTTDTMVGLNAMVEIQNMSATSVAHAWLLQNGFVNS